MTRQKLFVGKKIILFIIRRVKVPAIAKKTFDQLSHLPEFLGIVQFILDKISRVSSPLKRARIVHKSIDEFNEEIFAHPLVQQYSPCKVGCSACCHTQVSVTSDEAELLTQKIMEGVEINLERLERQASVSEETSTFYQLKYDDRACVFLDDSGACTVYEDRPSVCRTNAVLGDAQQCLVSGDTQQLRLVKTSKADMAIYASFLHSKESGSLPFMVFKKLKEKSFSLSTQSVKL
jgi:Fe-S-cluster containining protein